MIRAGLLAILSHWWRKPVQLFMLLAGLSLATALWSGVQALNAEARSAYATAEALLSQGDQPGIRHPSGLMDQSVFAQLRRAGWPVTPVLEGRAQIGDARLSVLGIDPLTASTGAASTATATTLGMGDPGAFLSGRGFVHPQTLAEIGTQSTLTDLVATDAVPVGTILVDISVAQRLLNLPDQLSGLTIIRPLQSTLPTLDQISPELIITTPGTSDGLDGLTASFHLNLTAFGLLAFAVGLFIVHSAIGLAFEQRRPLFRTLRALGMPLRVLMALLGAELLVFGLLAGSAGLVLGYVIAAALLPDVALTLRGLYGAPVPGSLEFDPRWALAGLMMTLGGIAVAGSSAIWQLSRLPVLASAQPRAWARAWAGRARAQTIAAVVLGCAALGLAQYGNGLLSGFLMLACVLLAAALLTPVILVPVLRLGQICARSVVGQWFWADSQQNLPRLSLALMALMLALSANIGVGTMVASFRVTFIEWLDQRLIAEVTVLPRTQTEAAQILDYLTPRADALMAMQYIDTTLSGQPVRVHAMTDHPGFTDSWPLLDAVPQVWTRLAAGEGVLINEQLHYRGGLGLNAPLDIPQMGTMPVLGVYPDYGNPLGQVLVTRNLFHSIWSDTPIRQIALRTGDTAGMIQALQNDLGLPDSQMTRRAEARALSLSIFERTFLITGALNLLTLGIAALALFATLITLSGMRQVQLAPLWAMGLTTRRLALLELGRAVLLGALTMVLALPVGLVLAHILLAVINVQAFGWRLPMTLFPGDWLRLALLAGGVITLSAGLAALRLWRRGGQELLRVFIHER